MSHFRNRTGSCDWNQMSYWQRSDTEDTFAYLEYFFSLAGMLFGRELN